MKEKILIVEDEFIVANDLRLTLEKAGYNVCGIAISVNEAREVIKKEKPSLALLDIHLKGKLNGIDLAKELKENNIGFIYLSANSNQQILEAAKATEPYGFLVKPYRETDLLVTLDIARYRQEYGLESRIRREQFLQNRLNTIIHRDDDPETRFLNIIRTIQSYIPFDFVVAVKRTDELPNYFVSFLRIGFDEYQMIKEDDFLGITGLEPTLLQQMMGASPLINKAALYNGQDFKAICAQVPMKKLFADTFQLASNIVVPVLTANGAICFFSFFSRSSDTFNQEHLFLLFRLQQLFANALEGILSKGLERIGVSSKQPSIQQAFEGIIGKSSSLLNVLDAVLQVAPFDTSVLLLGESGTGKERIADCIHHHSARSKKPFVKVNCAALPATLIESELFGHEKGSFTGATDKRTGKFEKANGGTIFLDEIGEMPIDLQVKLLRVLQEKEIEPIGSSSTIKINVRFIAATNRNLEKEVAEGRFRLDLYYRLNVFPIELPSLRERTEDIPALANYFINYYNHKTGKKITGISENVLKKMTAYRWPGNIRELENLIERCILLTKGTIIEEIPLPIDQKKDSTTENQHSQMKTIHENERDYIIAVLKKCKGRIFGAGGAAEVLNVPPTTLTSKMKKLGIQKENLNT